MNKYGARKTIIDGIPFDSKKEAERYQELKLLRCAGEIIDFTLQPKFELLAGFEKKGKKYKPITYTADFIVIYPDGRREVEDVKGVLTRDFQIRRKMFEIQYPDLTLVII